MRYSYVHCLSFFDVLYTGELKFIRRHNSEVILAANKFCRDDDGVVYYNAQNRYAREIEINVPFVFNTNNNSRSEQREIKHFDELLNCILFPSEIVTRRPKKMSKKNQQQRVIR